MAAQAFSLGDQSRENRRAHQLFLTIWKQFVRRSCHVAAQGFEVAWRQLRAKTAERAADHERQGVPHIVVALAFDVALPELSI